MKPIDDPQEFQRIMAARNRIAASQRALSRKWISDTGVFVMVEQSTEDEFEQLETEFYGQYFLLFSEDERHAVLFTQADYKLIAGPLPFLHRFFPDLSAQKQEFIEFKNEELSYRHTVGYEQAIETALRFMNCVD